METATADIIESEEEVTPHVTQEDLVEASRAVYDAVTKSLGERLDYQYEWTQKLYHVIAEQGERIAALQKQLTDACEDARRREEAQKDFYEKALQRQGEHLVKSLGTPGGDANVGDVVASYGKLLEDSGNRKLADLRKELTDTFAHLERNTQTRVEEMLTFLRSIPTPQVVVTDGAFNIHVPSQAAPVVQVNVPEQAVPQVHVTVPEQVPVVNVAAAPAPNVEVVVPQPRLVRKTFEYDGYNRPVSVTEEEVEDAAD